MTMELALIAKATVILGLALAATRLTCRSRASVRALILSSAFGLMLVMPVASALTPAREVPIPAAIAPAFFADDLPGLLAESATVPARATAPDTPPPFQLPSLRTVAWAVWLLGTVITVLPLAWGLWRVRRIRRRGHPWPAGDAAVDRLGVSLGLRRQITVILHDGVATPVTCGWIRPTIVMPIDAPAWTAEDVRQALLHELEHVRRHDWPVHVVARLTCGLYWFHPATWIAWRQLSLDSERACDDAVVSQAEQTAYAQQLVALARRVSTGRADPLLSMADRRTLATRVASILNTSIARGRVGALAVTAVAVFAVALSAALFPLQARAALQSGLDATVDAGLRFGVASVRPNDGSDPSRGFGFTLESGRLRLRNQTLRTIISVAYAPTFSLFFPDERISGGPSWMNTDRFTIDARAERAVTGREMSEMLRNLLVQRFNLKVRVETREAQVYALVLAKRDRTLGPQLKLLTQECAGGRCGIGGGAGRYQLSGATMALLAASLSELVGRPVYDRTNLSGSFEGTLTWAPAPEEIGALGEPARQPEFGVSLFTALEEQFGLKLQPERGGVDYLVVERAEQPTPNDAAAVPGPAFQGGAAAREAFEVASIRRNMSTQPGQTITQRGNTFVALNVTVRDILLTAFRLRAEQVSGGPGWIDSERYDVVARPRREASWDEHLAMTQTLLADRFKLVVRHETREAPAYALVVGRSGSKLKPANGDCTGDSGPRCGGFQTRPGSIVGRRVTVAQVANLLSGRSGRMVVNRTGIEGFFDVQLSWTPDPGQIPPGPPPDDVPPFDPNGPSLFAALQEQLGLRLDPTSTSIDHLVIERIDRPTPNDAPDLPIPPIQATAPTPPAPSFEIVSVKPNTGSDTSIPFPPIPPDGYTVVNRPLESLVRYAYDVQYFRVIDMPAWARQERFDITAKANRPITDAERRLMLRQLLADRFGLKVHFESRDQTVYVMTRARSDGSLGPGLKARPDCPAAADKCVSAGSAIAPAGRLSLQAATFDLLASGLMSAVLESLVLNESKVEGHFDVELSWRPDTATSDAADSRASFMTAVEEQLGMKLASQRRPVQVLVIDQIQRPTAN